MEKDGKRKRRKFSAEYKAETVRLIQRSGKSIGTMAVELGIRETALRRWIEQAEVEAGRGPEGALKRTEREELVELRRENQRLRLEREILKNDRMGGSGITCWTRNSQSDYLGGEPGSNGRPLFGDLENPLKNMVWGWLAHLIVVTPAG
ncbi:MAG TPA: transposase [Bryobacteraceae bacterium]|nr:transposase [Bryobacteraceae bacterium]